MFFAAQYTFIFLNIEHNWQEIEYYDSQVPILLYIIIVMYKIQNKFYYSHKPSH